MTERKFHVSEWEGLAPLIGNALVTGTALLHSTAPMTNEERAELSDALGKLGHLLKKSAEVATAKVSDDDLPLQMGASGDRIREEVHRFNQLMSRIATNIVGRAGS